MGGMKYDQASKQEATLSIAKTNSQISTATPEVSIQTPKGLLDCTNDESLFDFIRNIGRDDLQGNLDIYTIDNGSPSPLSPPAFVAENTQIHGTWPISSPPQWGLLGNPITDFEINDGVYNAVLGSEGIAQVTEYSCLEALIPIYDINSSSVIFYQDDPTPTALNPFVQQFPLLQKFEIELPDSQEDPVTVDRSEGFETEIERCTTDTDDQFGGFAVEQMQDISTFPKDEIRAEKILENPFPTEIVVIGEYIPVKDWAKAYMEEDICKAGMILFKSLFSKEEICRCTLSGRCDSEKLNQNKRNAILKAIWWMQNKEHKYPYPVASTIFEDPPVTVISEIEQKVFVEKRNEIRRKTKACPVVKRMKIEKGFQSCNNKTV